MRGWLQKLLDDYLNKVTPLGNSPEDTATAEQLATAMRQAWSEQGLSALRQQKNLITEVRGANESVRARSHCHTSSIALTQY